MKKEKRSDKAVLTDPDAFVTVRKKAGLTKQTVYREAKVSASVYAKIEEGAAKRSDKVVAAVKALARLSGEDLDIDHWVRFNK